MGRRRRVGARCSFFGKRSAPRTCCWRRRWVPGTCACGDLSTTTHPLQCRGVELDMQETSATEVCVSSFSFFLREKVSRETLKIGEESLSRQRIPNSAGVLDPSFKNKRHCCARVLGLLQGRWAGKHSNYGRIAGKCAPLVFFHRWERVCFSLPRRIEECEPSWSGRAQSCLANWFWRAPVDQGVPKVAW